MNDINHEQRAAMAWPVLAKVASERKTISYGDLAKAIGIHHRPLRYVLGHIQDYCLAEELPPLTILVVHGSGDRKPGTGFIAVDTLERLRARVFGFNWNGIPNPFAYTASGATQSDLADELLDDPGKSEDVYQRVKARGIAQLIFREAVTRAYEGSCAFCGLTFVVALEAAHVHPWSVCAKGDRINIRNGVLLCASHHRMFDKGFLSITEDFHIEFSDPEREDGQYSKTDGLMSVELHGKKMRLPSAPHLRPDPKLIAARRAIEADEE